jgi:hypothetical protein
MSRVLTEEDIDLVLRKGFTEPFEQLNAGGPFPKHAARMKENMAARLRDQLAGERLPPDGIADLIEVMRKRFGSSRVEPQTDVGITAAEAIGGPVTQASLGKDASKKNLKGGTSDVLELTQVSRTRKVEQCAVFFNRNYSPFDILNLGGFVSVTIDSLTDDASIINIKDSSFPTWWNTLQQKQFDFPEEGHALRIKLDTTKMAGHRITIENVRQVIDELGETLIVMNSPQVEGTVDVVPGRMVLDEESKLAYGVSNPENQSYMVVNLLMRRIGEAVVCGISGVAESEPVEIRVNAFVRAEELVADAPNGCLWKIQWKWNMAQRYGIDFARYATLCERCGLVPMHRITRNKETEYFVLVPRDPPDHHTEKTWAGWRVRAPNAFVKAKYEIEHTRWQTNNREMLKLNNWVSQPLPEFLRLSSVTYANVVFKGATNYFGILMRDDVNPYLTIPNNFHTIYRVLGTEAVRNYHIIEFAEAIASTSDTMSARHTILLTDVMTNRGGIAAINKMTNTGMITRASKSDAMSIVRKDAVFGTREQLCRGSLTSVGATATGRLFGHGTGSNIGMLIDEAKIAMALPEQPLPGRKHREDAVTAAIHETGSEDLVISHAPLPDPKSCEEPPRGSVLQVQAEHVTRANPKPVTGTGVYIPYAAPTNSNFQRAAFGAAHDAGVAIRPDNRQTQRTTATNAGIVQAYLPLPDLPEPALLQPISITATFMGGDAAGHEPINVDDSAWKRLLE